MTTIIAYRKQVGTTRRVWFGSDGQTTFGGTPVIKATPTKIFRLAEMIIGLAGDVRVGQVVRYLVESSLNTQTANQSEEAYVLGTVIETIRTVLKEAGALMTVEGNDSMQCEILIGYKGGLYRFGTDFSGVALADDLAAIGTGGDAALGAMRVLIDGGTMYPKDMLMKALSIASEFDIYTAKPFTVLSDNPLEG